MNKILVIGSTNIDMIACVKHLPRPGETVITLSPQCSQN